MEFGIEKCVMLIMRTGNRHMTERVRTAKLRKNQNAQRKGNLQILGNIGSGHHRTSGDKRKKFKKRISGERGNYWKPIVEISSKGQTPELYPPGKILWAILEVDEGRT